ncbi:transposase [Archangium lansingense]|uniref:transposase n=1 Tax=Archangium lansingense TaxID=2995310 RepID=UPI003B76B01C
MPREKSIAERFDAYVEKVGGRLYKPNRRFLREALFGLVEKKSVLLSQIGRALKEPSRLIHTEKRLSRNLGNKRYDDAAVEQDYLKLVAPILRDERYPRPTIAVDLTDIAKPRARKMPYLARVLDGSTKELADGYEVISIEAVGVRGRRLPLLSRLFSTESPEYKSQNATVFDAIATARKHVPDDAFWAFDSGFDGGTFFRKMEEMGVDFAVRLRVEGNCRTLFTSEGKTNVKGLVESTPRLYFHRPRGTKKKKNWLLQVGWVSHVHLQQEHPSSCKQTGKPGAKSYSLVTVSGDALGQEPLAILTTLEVKTADDARRVASIYLDRWGVEEANRFTKQGFDLEDVRALTWTGLKRMVQLVHLAYGFLALLVHGPRKQVERIALSFKAFGPVPEYLYYRLLEGLGRLLRDTMDGGP